MENDIDNECLETKTIDSVEITESEPELVSTIEASDINQVAIPEIEETDLSRIDTLTKSDKKYFYTEIMSTAGPRKNFDVDARDGDFDLGEDVVGCIIRKDTAYFWLLDGTSDNPIFKAKDGKEIFSSRMLAQEIAWNIQNIIWNKEKSNFSSSEVLKEAFGSIQISWEEKLNALDNDDKTRIAELLSTKNKLVVSSTVIFGSVNTCGHIDVSQIGDSYVITNPTHQEPENKGRFFVILKMNQDQNKLEIEMNSFEDTRCHSFNLDGISTIVLASDGLSQNTIKWLNMKPADFTNSTFRKTISAIKQGTCDDKALCVIQILTDD